MKITILLVTLLASAILSAADRHESHDRIRMLAERHAVAMGRSHAPADAEVRAESSRLDPRLRLAPCKVEPETFSPPGQRPGANVNVGLRCPTAPAWSLYVPVRLEVTAEVVVLGAPASRGDTLTTSQLRLERRDVARLGGDWITELEQAEGMMLRRLVQPGAVITQAMLERPSIVRRGDRVRIQSSGGAFAVSSEGEALSDAAAGDRLRVRNLHSRTVIEGVVDRHGKLITGS
ncbi:MAG: flagella basal body P-ring formation protein FlgA [Gammaproteobacteria bacterium]|nr:MAG: flagella basal body P-ring formation protein FlgA [Gammaproteobacteria bacterium]